MEITTTRVFDDNVAAWLGKKRRVLNQGGTASSKTYSILQMLILIAEHSKKPLLTSIVSESLPHLKRGAIRDFFKILDESDHDNPRYNKTEQVYTFDTGSKIEFFGADEPAKVRGPRRDILFINEGNNVPWDTARGLDIRTRLFTVVDWNPVSEFWVHEYEAGGKLVPGWLNEDDSAYIHSTYLDAIDVLPPEVVANIESQRDKDPNWWNIYGLGLPGMVEGLVYPFYKLCMSLPEGDFFYGLDFGYSNDPTVLTKHVVISGGLYSEELIYERGLTNPAIASRMDEIGVKRNFDEIFADSAEPKSIDELCSYGFSVKPAPKGPGSVEFGHQLVRQFVHYWTENSINCIKEQRNYRYIRDKNGKLTNKTTHFFSHGMDSTRYGVTGKAVPEPLPSEKVVIYDAQEEFGGITPDIDDFVR